MGVCWNLDFIRECLITNKVRSKFRFLEEDSKKRIAIGVLKIWQPS